MEINNFKPEDIEQALHVIYERATTYDGPLFREFMQLAQLAAPRSSDEDKNGEVETDAVETEPETRQQFEEALSFLMVLAFPAHKGTEKAVLVELNEVVNSDAPIKSLQMLVGDRRVKLSSHLGRRPTLARSELQSSLLAFLPRSTEVDL